MNYTPNYQLSQWVESDRVLMQNFNDDNAKIDAALSALNTAKADNTALSGVSQQLTALSSAINGNSVALAGKGNCEIFKTSYVGTGTYGSANPQVWTFDSGIPLFVTIVNDYHNVAIRMINGVTQARGENLSLWTFITWSGNTLSWYGESAGPQINEAGVHYHMVALLSRN